MARDPYDLTVGDLDWVTADDDRTADEHIDGLLRRRFKKNWQERFPTRAKKASACVEFTKRLQDAFKGGARDPLAGQALASTHPRATIRNFQNFCIGFTPAQLRHEIAIVRRERSRLLNLAAKSKKRHSTREARAKRDGDRTRKFLHDLYQSRLVQEENWINEYFSDPAARAEDALRQRARFRRFGPWSRTIAMLDTYAERVSWFEHAIERLHPDALSFPFRFYRALPLKPMRELRQRWREGETPAQLLPALEKHVDWSSLFDSLLQNVRQLGTVLPRVRARAVLELRAAWDGDAFLSVATVAATQVEGVLWDIAGYLNRPRSRIFRETTRGRFPYAWDFRKQDYLQKTKRGTPIAKMGDRDALLSARALLRHTRVGEFFPLDVHSFLMDEHYEDRCHYAHGGGTPRDVRADAVMALLCLSEVVDRALEIVEDPPEPA